MARTTVHVGSGPARAALVVSISFLAVACSGVPAASGRAATSPPASIGASTAASGAPEPTSAPPAAAIDGQLLLGSLTDDTEMYFVLDEGGRHQFFEAEGCHPCLSPSADGRYVTHPYIAPGDAFAAAVYDAATDTTNELSVPGVLSALGPGPLSPDSARFVRHGWSDADPTRNGLYTTLLDGSDLVKLAPITDGRGRDALEWSSDGASLLVFSEDETRTAARHLGDLSVVTVDSGATRTVNPDGTSVSAIIRNGTVASFSPDGSQVAFAARLTEQPDQTALFVAPVEAGEARQITDWGPGTTTALWSPAGDSILFDRDSSGGPSISLIGADGSGLRDVWVSTADAFGCCGTWSPDGARILFQRGSGGARELWVMDADGEAGARVDTDPAAWIWYRWTSRPEG